MDYATIRNCAILIKNQHRHHLYSKSRGVGFSIAFLLKSILKGQRMISIKLKDGLQVWMRTRSSDLEVFIQQFVFGELLHKEILEIRPVSILDAGGNIGLASMAFKRMFPNAKILSIEPDPKNFIILEKNLNQFSTEKVSFIQKAFLPKPRKGLSLHAYEGMEYATRVGPEQGDLEAIGIDSFPTETGFDPDLVKMDIEGSELSFFEENELFFTWLRGKWLLIELHGPEAYFSFFSNLSNYPFSNLKKVGEYWLVYCLKS